MAKLRFGTGGIPLTTNPNNVINGIKRIHELGLEHMELEFVRDIFLTPETAQRVKNVAEECDVSLTVHGSYFTNFASEDKKTWHGSVYRISKAAEIGALAGARSVTYHSGFRQTKAADHVYTLVKKATVEVLTNLREKGSKIRVSPELTGKPNQFGDLDELLKLVKELRSEDFGPEEIGFCFDFAHKFARSNGRFNSYAEFTTMLDQIVRSLGEEFLQDMHIHMSGIEFNSKGERNHLVLLQSLSLYQLEGIEVKGIEPYFAALPENRKAENMFNWRELLRALKDKKVGGCVVCESPMLELDALLMQKYYNSSV